MEVTEQDFMSSMSEDTMPEDTMPEETMPEDTMPEETTSEEKAKEETPVPPADLTPHGQLLAAFAVLKKEKNSLMALTELQKEEKEAIQAQLDMMEGLLEEERTKNAELVAKMELKAASTECQIEEVETFSEKALQDALEKNAEYSEKVTDLESTMKESKIEKEYLLQRMANMARRDQIQKASIVEMTKEIEVLTEKIVTFEDRFAVLATRSEEMSNNYKDVADGQREAPPQPLPDLKKIQNEWKLEKKNMTDRIAKLENNCTRMKQTEMIMKDAFVHTLSKHKEDWANEKENLTKQVKELVTEKENIESQVAEIAELLEKEHIERHGIPLSEDELMEPEGHRHPEVQNQ